MALRAHTWEDRPAKASYRTRTSLLPLFITLAPHLFRSEHIWRSVFGLRKRVRWSPPTCSANPVAATIIADMRVIGGENT